MQTDRRINAQGTMEEGWIINDTLLDRCQARFIGKNLVLFSVLANTYKEKLTGRYFLILSVCTYLKDTPICG